VRSYVAGSLPISIAERMAKLAQNKLNSSFPKVPISIETVMEMPTVSISTGCGIIIVAETSTGCLLAGSSIGRKGASAEDIALEAINELIEDLQTECCVDRFFQDQMIIFMALAKGTSRVKTGDLTLHTQTAIHFTQLLTGVEFRVIKTNEPTTSFIIECEGLGFQSP